MSDRGSGNDEMKSDGSQKYRPGAFKNSGRGRGGGPWRGGVYTTSVGSGRDTAPSLPGPSTPKRNMESNWRQRDTPQPITPQAAFAQRSPTTHKRKGLEEAFGNMGIKDSRFDSPSYTPPKQPTQPRSASRNSTFSNLPGGFPNWSSMRRAEGGLSPLQLLIAKANANFGYDMTFGRQAESCDTLFNQAKNEIDSIRRAVEVGGLVTRNTLERTLADTMVDVIFGSNAIERVGEDKRETFKLCEEVFIGKRSHLDSIPPRSEEYWAKLEELIEHASQGDKKPDRIRSRREVVNHAAALVEIINVVVKEGQPFSEDLIQNCHRILCHGVDADSGKQSRPWQTYAGIHRSKAGQDEVYAGTTNFVPPARVAEAMANFIRELNDSLRKAELDQSLDPFLVAANACGDFVNIHPFFDGNGRLCRLILNAITLKYAGIVVPIGETAEERTDYLSIARRRSENCEGNGELASMILKQAMGPLGSLRQRLEAACGK